MSRINQQVRIERLSYASSGGTDKGRTAAPTGQAVLDWIARNYEPVVVSRVVRRLGDQRKPSASRVWRALGETLQDLQKKAVQTLSAVAQMPCNSD